MREPVHYFIVGGGAICGITDPTAQITRSPHAITCQACLKIVKPAEWDRPSWRKKYQQEQRRRKAIDQAFMIDSPYPINEVIDHLCNAVDHLLKDHDCDHQGHEVWAHCVKVGREMSDALKKAI